LGKLLPHPHATFKADEENPELAAEDAKRYERMENVGDIVESQVGAGSSGMGSEDAEAETAIGDMSGQDSGNLEEIHLLIMKTRHKHVTVSSCSFLEFFDLAPSWIQALSSRVSIVCVWGVWDETLHSSLQY
jgi:hypothetical protein